MKQSKNPLLDALEYHREIKRRCIEWNKKHYSGLRLQKRKLPWYMLTKGKQYNYEQRVEPYGMAVQYYRVLSQAGKFHEKTVIRKMTHDKYIEMLIEAKLSDWVKKNPCPIDIHSPQGDLFAEEYLSEWYEKKRNARKTISIKVTSMSNKITVYARYKGDEGYPHKIKTFKSDGQKFIINNGAQVNKTKTITKMKSYANALSKKDPNFISLMITDGKQKCILIPEKNHFTKAA